ncbi:AEC family transporter [Parahaliea aestuarii]|uniref:AEC family transporter n=1 Tax=Parahaliea aestuarii TaxID=1852021 RepID=UPI0016505F26|nr:AEC family transporter [Parahaliea aestuarii]
MTDLAINLDLLPRIVGILAPIVAIVLVGYFYGLRHNPEMAVANRINMDIFVPALILGAMASKNFEPERYIGLASGAAILLIICGLVARPVARWMAMDWRTFVPPMMFNNSANIGIPLAVLTWGESALPAAVILYTVSNVMHFSIGVHMLDQNARLLTLWRNPTLIAVAIGLTIATLQIPVWEPVVTSLQLLGNVAVPLLLFSLGVRMQHVRFNDLGAPLIGAFLRPLLGMALAGALALLLGLNARDTAMLLVFGALPPAVMNFLFAERYQRAPEQVAAIVLIGNLAALVMLPLALMLAL